MTGKSKKKNADRRAARTRTARRKAERAAARRERRAEEHARLIRARQGDPNYVSRFRDTDGAMVYELTDELASDLRDQRVRFVEKFGREPTNSDPVFFDPEADEPSPPSADEVVEELRKGLIAAGLDDAHADAFEELGYIVTDANKHLFSASECDEYTQALRRAQLRSRGCA